MEASKVSEKKLKGEVFKVKENLWQARIMDGWYVGFGTTKEKACRQAEKRYKDEQNARNGHR
jgi:hypothetical protein